MVSILSYVGRQGSVASALPVACEGRFYRGLAIAMALVCFAGFAPSYYLKGHFHGGPQLSLLLHVHGLAFTAWIGLFLAQTSLIAAAGRTGLHRRLGIAGAVLAVLMMVLGAAVALVRARQGVLGQAVGAPPLVFLAIPFATLIVFPALIGAALYFRKRDTHKRLMMLGTTEIVTAAVARLPGLGTPLAFFAATDLFVLALLIHDFASRGRVHRATFWGGLLLIASQPLRVMIADTPTWLEFARWLTGA